MNGWTKDWVDAHENDITCKAVVNFHETQSEDPFRGQSGGRRGRDDWEGKGSMNERMENSRQRERGTRFESKFLSAV